MRTPSHKRTPPRRSFGPAPDSVDLAAVAELVSYVGSPEHKDEVSFAGKSPRPRNDASICDRSLNGRLLDINRWLKEALKAGQFSGLWDQDRFPRYIWHREGDDVFEARLVNAGSGEYKGYKLNRDEWPEGIQ